MSFLSRLLGLTDKAPSATMAKERLKILISHERVQTRAPDFLPALKKEIIDVISKYVRIDPEQIQIAMDCAGDTSSLELNFTIPEVIAANPPTTPTKKAKTTTTRTGKTEAV